MNKLRAATIACLLVCAATSAAADDWLDAEHRRNLARFADEPTMLVERGLLADAKRRYVDVLATSTGAGSSTTIDTLITSADGDASRALAVTPVTPAALQAALEFIGLEAGRPADPERHYYWPRGERVVVTVDWHDDNARPYNRSARIEQLVRDRQWDETLPQLGLRFVGPGDGNMEETAIATSFNAQNTVLEVPWLVDRRTAAARFVGNEAIGLDADRQLRIRLRPEFRDDRRRTHDFIAAVAPGSDGDSGLLRDLAVDLKLPDGTVAASGGFEAAYVYMEKLINDGNEPFLEMHLDDALSAQSARNVARFVASFLVEQQIRIEPVEGELFFRAFLAPDAWRDPAQRGRSSQPLEIYWGTDGQGARLLQHADTSGSAARQAQFDGVDGLVDAVRGGAPWDTDGVFLFVDAATPYAEVRMVYDRLREDFPNVYVFM